jgi:hypothetical protein
MAPSETFAEDELGRKWDRCLTDLVLKTGNCVYFGSVEQTVYVSKQAGYNCLHVGQLLLDGSRDPQLKECIINLSF